MITATWNEIEQQENARYRTLARIARELIAAETGISEDEISDVVNDEDLIEALQLDNLDHYYIYGFMPDSPEERPEHPLEYPGCDAIVSDIRAQIAAFWDLFFCLLRSAVGEYKSGAY